MRNLFCFIFTCCAFVAPATAQDLFQELLNPEEVLYSYKGMHEIHVGIGWPNLIGTSISAFEAIPDEILGTVIEEDGKSSPQFTISYDYGVTETVSIGPYLGYMTASTPKFRWSSPAIEPIPILLPNGLSEKDGIYSYDVTVLSLGARALIHRPFSERFELYGVFFFGFNMIDLEEQGTQPGEQGLLEEIGILGIGIVDVPVPEISYSAQLGGQLFLTEGFGIYAEAGYGVTIINAGLALRF